MWTTNGPPHTEKPGRARPGFFRKPSAAACGALENKKRCAGFTLFELLVVMALVGLVAALVLPRIGGSQDKINLRAAAGDVAAIMRHARSQAVSRGRTVCVFYHDSDNRIVVKQASGAKEALRGGEAADDDLGVGAREYFLPKGITLAAPSMAVGDSRSGRRLAVFSPIGAAAAGGLTLTDSAGRKKIVVVDRITGSVTIGAPG